MAAVLGLRVAWVNRPGHGGGVGLLIVSKKEGEDAEQLLRRFTKMVQRDGVLQEARRRRHFISRREKERQAQRRAARRRRRIH